MNRAKDYLFKNFEQVFVLAILVGVAATNYLVPYKIAFLDCYFIPILLAAYYLDARRAVLGAVFCSIMVGMYFWLDPDSFACGSTTLDLALNLMTWASFLILTAAVVGRLHVKVEQESRQSARLHEELGASRARLENLMKEVESSTAAIEDKVCRRTEALAKSRQTIENVKNKVEEALFATMDPEVAKLIIEERLRIEKRKISVMFCDLVGFTGYSEERQPELVIGDLNNFLGEMEGVVLDYRGHIDKYTGDGLMVEFGAPINYERHALLAVVAGLKMQERTRKAGFPWKMRLGIATGDPIVGLIGRKRQNYTAIGDTVNLASRIEEASRPGVVTVDEQTFEKVKGFVEAEVKTVLPGGEFMHAEDMKALSGLLGVLEHDQGDLESLKKAGLLFLKGKDVAGAHEFFKRALSIDPQDDQLKLAYADTSIQLESLGALSVRGRKRLMRLHEITGLRDMLNDPERIPANLYRDFNSRVRDAVEYPEDLLLPVECLDASVGLSRAVGFLAYVIADILCLPEQDKRDALLAGYLADIGKTIVPHHLLNRAGSLDRAEFEEVKKHCAESVRVLRKLGYRTQAVFDIIASHHEYFNGSGYPHGLAGDRIPMGSRIVAVAEEYVSYVYWRPYRDPWNLRAAFGQIVKETQKGKFDPAVTEAFSRALNFIPSPAV